MKIIVPLLKAIVQLYVSLICCQISLQKRSQSPKMALKILQSFHCKNHL